MDRRTILAILLIMGVLIGDQVWTSWQARQRQAKQPALSVDTLRTDQSLFDQAPSGSTTTPPVASTPPSQPGMTPAGSTLMGAAPAIRIGSGPKVPQLPTVERQLKTDLFEATFTSLGGTVTSWILPHYPDLARGKEPVNLVPAGQRALRLTVTTPYFSYDFTDVPFRVESAVAFDSSITFVAEDSTGIRVKKIYRTAPGGQALDLELRVTVPPEYGPIQYKYGWANPLPITEKTQHPHEIQAVALVGDKLEAMDAPKLQKDGSKALKGNVRWAGSRSKYFVAAIIPDSATVEDVQFVVEDPSRATVWLAGTAPPGTEVVRRGKLYAGPIHYDTLIAQGAELDRLANLGWRWVMGLSAFLLWCLNFLYKLIPNYGIAIILISAATKLVFYPLTQSSLRSMKLMHHLQPEVKALQDRYKGDPTKMNKQMMDLYKKNKVNPLSGCMPMILQIPVFIALYNVLLNSIELRGAGFMGYVNDLSVPDVMFSIAGFPIHFFPILMTGSTYLMQAQTPVAPAQKPMMMLMPVMMLVFMYSFPSGVVLYWIVNNVLSALQQYLVNAAEDRKMAAGG